MTGRLPAPNLAHLEHLTDDLGLHEHAVGTEPNEKLGYCVDDAARALVLTCLAPSDGGVARLRRHYLAFTISAVTSAGTCHNRLRPSGEWADAPGLGDWWGRAAWGLGVAATAISGDSGQAALKAFETLARNRSPFRRSMAYAALGAAALADRSEAARALLADAAATVLAPADRDTLPPRLTQWPTRSRPAARPFGREVPDEQASTGSACVVGEPASVVGEPASVVGEPGRVVGKPGRVVGEPGRVVGEPASVVEPASAIGDPPPPQPSPAWAWPEPRLTYDNAVLPWALLGAGSALDRSDWVEAGLVWLNFLAERQLRQGHLSVVPVGGADATTPPGYDQQPIELASLAGAGALAYDLTGDERWRRLVRLAAEWFTGDNDNQVPMFDPRTGAGNDGLTPTGPNQNCGAESTLAANFTLLQAHDLGVSEWPPSSSSTPASTSNPIWTG